MRYLTLAARISLVALLVAGAQFCGILGAQTVRVKSQVADSVPHYQRATALTGPIEIPFTDGLLDLGDEWSQAFKKFQPEGSLLPNTSVISKWVWNPNTPGAVSLESSAFRAKRSGSFEGITTPAPIALT
jgi:hypothetical protein